jgi:single-strand DNA-binding protein
MNDINKVIIVGRLTRDAELKYTSNGFAVCKFSLAVNRRRKSGDQWVEEANFFDVVLWGRTAEALNQYLVKGKQVAVEGELRQNRWEQDGQPRSKVEISAINLQLLGGAGGTRQGGDSGSSGSSGSGSGNDFSGGGDNGVANDDNFEDDIPF